MASGLSQHTTPDIDRLREELSQVPRILLIRLRSLGDSILTLPLVEALQAWRPELELGLISESPFAPVFQNHPAVKNLHVLRTPRRHDRSGSSRFHIIRELRRKKYPAVINLHGGTTSMLLAAASGAELRIGQKSHRKSWIYNRQIPSSEEIWQKSPLHTVEHQLSLMRWLRLPLPARPATLHVDDAARSSVRSFLNGSGITEYFVIHPSATLATKQWQAEKFAALGDWLSGEYRLPVVYTAAAHELPVLQQVQQAAHERHFYRADFPLAELFALIESCRLFVGNDSGPMHAAATLGRPVVAIWGSSNVNAWHPWGTEYRIVRSSLPCIPCPGYECRKFDHPRCITDISVDRAVEACAEIMSGS